MQTNNQYKTELLMLNTNTWKHLTVCRKMINIELDWNIWWIDLLMLNCKNWNHLTMCKQIINNW